MNTAAASFEPKGLRPRTQATAAEPGTSGAWTAITPAHTAPDRLGDAWRDLADHAAEPNAFAEIWFASAGLRHLGADEDVRMIEVWSSSGAPPQLLGLLPLSIERRYGRAPLRHVQNWLHFHNFLGSPLVRSGHEQAFWSAALGALDADPWARGFLHINTIAKDGPVHCGLVAATSRTGRRCDIVYSSERALLASSLSPQEYLERHVRKKKRKELKRLAARLAEIGRVEARRLSSADELEAWCDAFLALERAGWKGAAGSALSCNPATESFFREAVAGGFAAGRLDLLRLDLNGRPIAMLVNFLTPPGGFSFKIAYDENYARFSPGVLIQLENLQVLARGDIEWMDSCAVENHPMINSLWAERRNLVRVSVPLAGLRRGAAFRLCRLAEEGSAALRRLRSRRPKDQEEADDDE